MHDLGLIFELISAFTLSFLDFIWPGGFYLLAERKFADKASGNSRLIHKVNAWTQIVLGVCVFLLMIAVNISDKI